MPFCSQCGKEMSEDVKFCSNCGAGMSAGTTGSMQSRTDMPYVDNHLVKSILATIFCCIPLGIAAIIQASSVSSRLNAGDIEGARMASQQADNLSNWAVGIGVLGWIILIIFRGLGENY